MIQGKQTKADTEHPAWPYQQWDQQDIFIELIASLWPALRLQAQSCSHIRNQVRNCTTESGGALIKLGSQEDKFYLKKFFDKC